MSDFELSTLKMRVADHADVPQIVALLRDDILGQQRENDLESIDFSDYDKAFKAIDADPNAYLYVLVKGDVVVACSQLNILAYLTHQGGRRSQVEGVRVHADYRGHKIGEFLFKQLIDIAKSKDCFLMQLTTDKQRPDAIRFYENLGFASTHEGMKLKF